MFKPALLRPRSPLSALALTLTPTLPIPIPILSPRRSYSPTAHTRRQCLCRYGSKKPASYPQPQVVKAKTGLFIFLGQQTNIMYYPDKQCYALLISEFISNLFFLSSMFDSVCRHGFLKAPFQRVCKRFSSHHQQWLH